MLGYLIEKEFKQFRRNKFLPKMVVGLPVMMLLILPWATDMVTKNLNLIVVDNDHTTYSQRLADKAFSSEYFRYAASADSFRQAMELVEKGSADIILEIPRGFERGLVNGYGSEVLISANSINGTKGMLGGSYLSAITTSFAGELISENGGGHTISATHGPSIEVSPRARFNPNLNYQSFMVPALMVMLLTLIGGFLPALNVVSEKETGTIEQMNVTPVPKITFILAKLIPYWIIGFVVLTISFAIAWLVYGLVPAGSLLTAYAASVLYVIALSGFGIVISNYSGTMQQAMFVMFFFMLIFLLMSGLFTPVRSMPQWAQIITYTNPLRYFIEIMRGVYLKGSSAAHLSMQFGALFIFTVISNLWATLSYRKRR